MKKNYPAKLITAALLISLNALSARVAVTDSGTDFSHEWLASRQLINTNEIPGNRIDDDRNGKVDDVFGWNFADNYGKVFFREHVRDVSPRVYKVLDVLSRVETNTQTDEDKVYFETNVKKLSKEEKQKLVTELNFYGQYAHSTHVSGIIAAVAPKSFLMSNRMFPDSPLSFINTLEANQPKANLLDLAYKYFGMIANGSFDKIALYINERKIDVANYSVGLQLAMIAGASLSLRKIIPPKEDVIAAEVKTQCPVKTEKEKEEDTYKKCATNATQALMAPYNEKLSLEVSRMYAQFEVFGKRWLTSAPNTLFVIASGNDGSDNDKRPTFPSNIRTDNSISVGASHDVMTLAKFSNYGLKSVDVVAPGVAIKSSVPSIDGKMVLPMSGTSMAAPYVTGVAANIKDINSNLTPVQMKQILMGTVDKKDWAKTKVLSGGVVNAERAYAAAEKTKSMSIELAIQESLKLVQDQPEKSIPKRLQTFSPIVNEMREFSRSIVF